MISVCLVDDQNLVRQGVRSLLDLSEDIRVVAECADGAQAVQDIPRIKPDVVLLDLRMPNMSGLEVLRLLSSVPLLFGLQGAGLLPLGVAGWSVALGYGVLSAWLLWRLPQGAARQLAV